MLSLYQPHEASAEPRRPNRTRVGLSRIVTYQPGQVLPNAWYGEQLARKFERHTGIAQRRIADESELSLAKSVVRRMEKLGVDLADCAGCVVACPSLVPAKVAHRLLGREKARLEQPSRLAQAVVSALEIEPRFVCGINGFCSGYARAMQLVLARLGQGHRLKPHEFVMVITTNCISRITDFEDRQCGALFGDFATATVIAPLDSPKYPAHLELVDAAYQRVAVARSYFDFCRKENVLVPTPDGGASRRDSRVVFTLDGMGIADTAPRAMAEAALAMAETHGIEPGDVGQLIPHQAGKAIVRLAGMKLDDAGFVATPLNGLTQQVGNISSGSVPYALAEHWDSLSGKILCPVAAVGAPGKAEVSRGCIYLRALEQAARRAA